MNPTWRAMLLAIAVVAAAPIPGDAARAAPGEAMPAGVAWALFLAAVVLLGAALGELAVRAGRLARRAGRAEARLRRLTRAARDLEAATTLLPSPPASGLREAFEQDCAWAKQAAEAAAQEAAACRESLRRGLGLGAGPRIDALEAQAEALEAAIAAIASRLAGVRDELGETARCLEAAAEAIQALCASTEREAPGGVWCEDLRGRLAETRRALDGARAALAAGKTLEALRTGRRLRHRLADLRRILEARRASLVWLERVPADLASLAEEAARMARAGHRGLPQVPAGTLAAEAREAIAALQGGDPRRAAAIQAAVRLRLDGLRRAIIGREELRLSNQRRLGAARVGLTLLEAAIAALPRQPVRRRFTPPSWAAASQLENRLVARAREVEMTLRRAEQANHLDAQAFEGASHALGHAERVLAHAHVETAQCAAAWRAPLDEEARLSSQLARLLGEAGAAYARARGLRQAAGPGVEALLAAARSALSHEPVDLAAARRSLDEAERELARYRGRLDAAERDAASQGRWRGGHVVILPPEAAVESAEDAHLGRK